MYLSYRNLPQINPIKTKKNLNSVNNNFLFKSFFHLSSHIDKYHPVFFRDNRVKEKVIFARFIISAFVTYSDLFHLSRFLGRKVVLRISEKKM